MLLRSNPVTPLDCWKVVEEFRASVGQVEQVRPVHAIRLFSVFTLCIALRELVPIELSSLYMAFIRHQIQYIQ